MNLGQPNCRLQRKGRSFSALLASLSAGFAIVLLLLLLRSRMKLQQGLVCGFVFFCIFSGVSLCDEDGMLSLSCGGTTSYVDSFNISWLPDNDFVSTGNTSAVDYAVTTRSLRVPIRFFPNPQSRNCYKLPLKMDSSSVLIRTVFLYKNYDRLQKPPLFSISLGTAIFSTVDLSATDPWTEEFVWPVKKDTVSLCFHAIPSGGAPLLSSIEVRPLPFGAYKAGLSSIQSLRKKYRINCGYNGGSIRYPFDRYDRIWEADNGFTPLHVSSGFRVHHVFNSSVLMESPPSAVLQTARVLARKDLLAYNFPLNETRDYFIVLYFAGILPVDPSFDVSINGKSQKSNYLVKKSDVSALYFTQKDIKSLNITLKSIELNPQINAIEVYQIIIVPSEVSSTTVSALRVIQQTTGLDLGWIDDPCSPKTWNHVGCEGNLVTALELSDINLRSINPTFSDLLDLKTLDLHNTSLKGAIQNLDSLRHLEKLNLSFNQLTYFGADFGNLLSLQILDLRNNSLAGEVPESLGQLEDLHLLNLENNKLQGTLPQSLNKDSLKVRTSGNLCLSLTELSCNNASSNPSIETPLVTVVPTKKHNSFSHLPITLGAVSGAFLAVITICLFVFIQTRKDRTEKIANSTKAAMTLGSWNSEKKFSYKDIKAATNNFKELIGRGSFGSVYRGKLTNGRSVAVKVRSDKSQIGAESFRNEVHLLSRIHHQNLVRFEGFCQESKQQILVYEYLPGGSLADHLYGTKNKKISLSWVRRLKIAVDAAKGLDYLHNGTEPRIIHRDIKCSNILFDVEMNAKLCDFGLSKQVNRADATHVTTIVKGTAGYLDPEYYSTRQLSEKSDVYSFGVVLLELISGREPLIHHGSPDSFNLVLWAKPYLQAGALEIVDERLRGRFDEESMKKAALIAVKCVERDASQRPTIAQVLTHLQEAYTIQSTTCER